MPRISTRIIRSLLFSLLLGLFPIIALWRYNLGQLANAALLNPLLITVVFILLSFGLGLLISRSWEKAGLFSALTSVFTLSFGHIYNVVGQKVILGLTLGYVKLLVIYAFVFLLLILLVLRAKKVSSSIFLFGNLLGAALLVINFYPMLVHDIQLEKINIKSEAANTETAASGSSPRPDIYYIVLDAYARSDIMQEVMGYDNSGFIQALQERGFYIPDCAYSNYDGTMKTITSVLNMTYLSDLNVSINEEDEFIKSNNELVINNRAREAFKQLGYQFVTGRGYNSLLDINDSDVYLNYWRNQTGNDDLDKQRFSSLYFNTTILRVFSEIYKSNPAKAAWLPYWLAVDRESNAYLKEATFWYYQNNYMFDSLETIPARPGNYFVYAHINAPHGPYVFRANGSFNYPLDSQDDRVLYVEAVKYINQRVLEVVDTLQSTSDVQPIIILQADHSIHVLTTGLNKHKILSAYYLPGDLNTPPYPTITPVNNFRLILKDYFDASELLLPDTLFVKYTNDFEPVEASCDLNSE